MRDQKSGQTNYQNNFHFLRLFFACLVIYSHSYPVLRGNDETEPLNRLTRGQLTFGALSVDAFFVISGFLITQSWFRSRRARAYFRSRVLRIYPAYIVAALVSVAAVVLISHQHTLGDWRSWRKVAMATILLNQYSWPGLFGGNPVSGTLNASIWTVKYEFLCYLAVALAGMVGLLSRRKIVAAALALAIALQMVYLLCHVRGVLPDYLAMFVGMPAFWPRFVSYFLAGTVFYLFRERIPRTNLLAVIAAAVMLGTLLASPLALHVILPLAGTYWLIWFAFQPRIRLAWVGRWGDFSYGTYLYAFPIQQLLVEHLGNHRSPWQLFAWALPLSVLAGILSWHLLEKYFMRLKGGGGKPAPTQPAQEKSPRMAIGGL